GQPLLFTRRQRRRGSSGQQQNSHQQRGKDGASIAALLPPSPAHLCLLLFSHQPPACRRLPGPQDYQGRERRELLPGQTYRFRVAGINCFGQGDFSPCSEFKTCQPGFPGAPSAVRISKASDSVQITWEAPSSPSGRILEYSMYLAVKKSRSACSERPGQMAFIRIYRGTKTSCSVNSSNLENAHIDSSASNRPAIVFRIAAKNEQGYGPATQIRWIQDPIKLRESSSAEAEQDAADR
uniref:Fibronectin type-III domain-containing protein n=1 Tax=Oryzias sinensis TaxID=183150 RepID=A0A8C8DLC0_9TELE